MDSLAPQRLRFDTDGLPERDRFPAFFEEIVRRLVGIEMETDNPLNFHAKLDLRLIGALGLGFTTNAAVATTRTADLIHDGDDRLCVMFLEKGAGYYRSPTGAIRNFQDGDATTCDYACPGSYGFTATSESCVLQIPRERITKRLPGVSFFDGLPLDRDVNARRLLHAYLRNSAHLELRDGERAAELFQDHVIDLLALALGAEGDSRQLAEHRGARAARLVAVLRAIEHRSGDAGLSAAAVARRLGVSPRYVHLLLEETGKSFTHHVLERRLERAEALLRDPRWRDRKVADVAAAAGFTDLSYFNRAFRRHFGATPSQLRASAPSDA